MHNGECINEVKGYRVVDCRDCGFIHIDPIPGRQQLEAVYREEYYTREKPLFIERQMEDLEWWNVVYDDRYEFFERRLPEGRRSILDIGSGAGFFLKRGKDRGWKTFGIEPSKQAADYSRGLGVEVLNLFFEEADFGDRKFDAVHLSEVLEHIPDPFNLCKKAYELLECGGILCAVVPNDYNPFQRVLRERLGFDLYWLAPPHHINYFNFDSLEGVLKRAGFRIIYRTAMFPMDIFLLMGDNYVGNDSLGRSCHARRKRFDIMLDAHDLKDFKRKMYEVMAEYGIGRETVVYGLKDK